MSKAVTNEEVEDVLSSIRRLVSEDKRPLAGLRNTNLQQSARSPEPEDDAEDIAPAADRLVLTPALRVADEMPSEEEDGQPLDLGSVARETWSAPLDVSDHDDEHDGGPMMLFPADTQEDIDTDVQDATDTDALDALVQDALEIEAQSDNETDEHEQAEHEDEDALEESALELHADRQFDAVDDDAMEDSDYSDEGYWDVEEAPHPDMAEDADEGDAPADASDWDIDDDMVPLTEQMIEPAFEDEQQSDGNPKEDAAEHDETPIKRDALFFEPENRAQPDAGTRQSGTPLTAKLAALEAAVGDIANDWEPDGDEIETLAASVAPAMAWEDDVPLDATGAPLSEDAPEHPEQVEATSEAPPETVAAATTQAAGSADDQMMDEDALRDLVSEIVRAELQGALGERITRNVRKLVRREIHRALTAQEME